MKLYCIWILLLTSVAFPSVRAAEPVDKRMALPQKICSPDSKIAEPFDKQGYVKIGGIDQWITVKGTRCSNPVVLFVHGGPGNPLSLYSDSIYAGWEKEFTIVHWDQRGSGKTYEANQEMGELDIEQLNKTAWSLDLVVSDGIAVADYLHQVLGVSKVILSGTSWGSVVAVKMARAKPGNFYAYIGLSQLVNYPSNLAKSYARAHAIATGRNDQVNLTTLNEIGSPPWSKPRNFGVLRKIIRQYENEMIDTSPELVIALGYQSEKSRAAYVSGEDFSYVKFVGLKGDGVAQNIALDKTDTDFALPVYLIQGENDLLTLPEVTSDYFKNIKAPRKQYVTVSRAGHDPNYKMLAKQLEILKQVAKLK